MMQSSIIGIMSGSSLDGLDMALCRFEEVNETTSWEILKAQTIPFPDELVNALKKAPLMSGFDLMKLDADFGKFTGIETANWIRKYDLSAEYIASHGHTIFHEPAKGFTTQIGSGAHIAFESSIDTITSFRNADVAAGGQGAPFAPVADRNLFPGYKGYLNLGGIANINLQTPDDEWLACDVGPCNQPLNMLAQRMGMTYDIDGIMASKGNIKESIVDVLLEMYPSMLGQPYGLSNATVQSTWIKYLNSSKENPIDLLATTSEAIARLVAVYLSPLTGSDEKILVTGGGAHNLHLMRRIKALANSFKISIELPARQIIDYKESLLMAYLGYLTVHGRSYAISDVTGADADTIGGALFKAPR